MKKTFKRAGVAVLSMAMLLSMGAIGGLTASAATALTVHDITNASGSAVTGNVKVYQVAYRNTDGLWYANAPYTSYQATIRGLSASTSATDLNTLARGLMAITNDSTKATDVNKTVVSATSAATSDTTPLILSDVSGEGVVHLDKNGYYLVVTTDPTAVNPVIIQPSLVEIDANSTAAVTPKANPINITKTITDTQVGAVSSTGNTSVGIVGSKVSYRISSQIPRYDTAKVTTASDYVITDNPSAGLDIKNGESTFNTTNANLKVWISDDATFGSDTDKTNDVAVEAEGDGFKVTLTGTQVLNADYAGKYIFVTFDATVTNSAVKGSDSVTDASTVYASTTGNPNRAYVSYGNNFSTGGYAEPDGTPTNVTPPPTPSNVVTTYIGKVVLNKKNFDGTADLTGATFTLSGATAKTLSMGANSTIDFGYLPNGNYTLTETVAPSGCKVMATSWTFTVDNDSDDNDEFDGFTVATTGTAPTELTLTDNDSTNHGDYTVQVNDPPADSLPGTGGMGTTLFTVGGAVIVLMAGFMFVLYMRKRKTEE